MTLTHYVFFIYARILTGTRKMMRLFRAFQQAAFLVRRTRITLSVFVPISIYGQLGVMPSFRMPTDIGTVKDVSYVFLKRCGSEYAV